MFCTSFANIPRLLGRAVIPASWIVSILAVGLSGCDNTVEPYGNRSDTYSVYGYLAENREDQFVRVKRLDALLSDQEGSLDVVVRLKNLTDGRSELLRDSMITYEDEGSTVVTHNFWTDTPVQPETRYRLILEHPDGDTTAVTTTTPASVEGIPRPTEGNCETLFTVKFPPIEDPRRVVAALFFKVSINLSVIALRIPQAAGVGEDGSAVIRFTMEDVIGGMRRVECENIISDRIKIFYTYLGGEWYGQIPKDTISSHPIHSPYVNNGRGYFGSLWRDTVSVGL